MRRGDEPRVRQYTSAHRAVEIAAIVAAAVLALHVFARLVEAGVPGEAWLIAAAAIGGYVAADFLSGLAHWLFDTWGSADTPVVGPGFIRPFREHHDDAASITRHDFIETNGNNCLAAVPVLMIASVIPTGSRGGVVASAFLLFTSLAVIATNQFHKWAHAVDPGPIVRRLQRWHLILPADHHGAHHEAPHTANYCITTGWMNPLLGAIDFHRRLERVITGITGAVPRRHPAIDRSRP